MANSDIPCPCGSGQLYSVCCGPLHQNAPAPDATRLMRSRYSAFSLGKVNYLLATLAPESRQANDARVIEQTLRNTRWLGLKLLDSGTEADHAWVEFVAFYQNLGGSPASRGSRPDGQLHERSRFVQHDGRWCYLDGQILPAVKWSRNDPCWCGSGKKLKKCCGA